MSVECKGQNGQYNDQKVTNGVFEMHEDNLNKLTYTVQEAGKIMGISKNAAYQAVNTGDIPSIRIGGRIVVPRAALEHLLKNCTADK